jgi:hypothetical protein
MSGRVAARGSARTRTGGEVAIALAALATVAAFVQLRARRNLWIGSLVLISHTASAISRDRPGGGVAGGDAVPVARPAPRRVEARLAVRSRGFPADAAGTYVSGILVA